MTGRLSRPDGAGQAGREKLRQIALLRRDLATLLFHWVRPTADKDAFGVLWSIVEDRALRGASPSSDVADPCVCFSETPITEAAALFKARSGPAHPTRYWPYGIAVHKHWLFERGGRPVIYQAANELSLLPSELQWRHCTYDPTLVRDFTCEREWRIQSPRLELDDPKLFLVVVPTAFEAYSFMHMAPYTTDGPAFLAVSLDFFGLDETAQ